MKKLHYSIFGIFLPLLLLAACTKQTTPQDLAAAPASASTPAASLAKPTLPPEPTPTPFGPNYGGIRSNREIMNPEQIAKYGPNLSGKKIGGWVGYVAQVLESDETGKCRLVIDVDNEEAGQLPDIILEGIPAEIAKGFQPRQGLNFSGTIQGFVDIPDCRFLLSLSGVQIFGYPF